MKPTTVEYDKVMKKREEFAVGLRKDKRKQILNKRRKLNTNKIESPEKSVIYANQF